MSVEVIPVKVPRTAEKIAQSTAKMLKELLVNLEYTGNWQMAFIERRRQKVDKKFKVVRRADNGIRCHTKPGDNETSWEVQLVPPVGYIVADVYRRLEEVHPNKLCIPPPPAAGEVPLAQDIPNTLEPEKSKPKPAPIIPRIKTPTYTPPHLLKGGLGGEDRKTKTIMGVPVAKPKEQFTLKLDANKITSLCDDPVALMHGVVVASFVLNPVTGYGNRQIVSDILVKELDLARFSNQSDDYTNAKAAVRGLLTGLCRKGYLQRIETGDENTVNRTTKGYQITDAGKAKINAVKPTLPDDIQKRIFAHITSPAEKAEEFLCRQLIGGDISSNEIKQIASDHGIKISHLEAARESLGVIRKRVGWGQGSYFVWSMPAGDDENDDEFFPETEEFETNNGLHYDKYEAQFDAQHPLPPDPKADARAAVAVSTAPVAQSITLEKIAGKQEELRKLLNRHDELIKVLAEYDGLETTLKEDQEKANRKLKDTEINLDLVLTQLIKLQKESDKLKKIKADAEHAVKKANKDIVDFNDMRTTETNELAEIKKKLAGMI